MFTVQNDWIEYEEARPGSVQTRTAPARRAVVRGGAACAQRVPVTSASRRQPVALHAAAARPQAAAHRQRPGVQQPVKEAPRLRLTRRGRVVLVVLPALAALSAALIAAGPGVAEAAPRVASATVVVGGGDSLWTIAERIAPDTDPRVTVAAIERANHLPDARVAAGAVLRLPAEG